MHDNNHDLFEQVDLERIRKCGYLRVVDFAFWKAVEGETFTREQLAKELGVPVNTLGANPQTLVGHAIRPAIGDVDGEKWQIKPGAFFSYLEFIEIREAQRSSRIVQGIATLAIVVSVILGLISRRCPTLIAT